ncbi:MAG TPA: hypothetical protein VFG86_03580 [Chloroflexota bacterium]|jgi:hypothetical protein|nr:hypothetical protein [Chloroflexota bacterium]
MRRIARATLLALAALSVFASLAFAASVHFKGEQTFTDNGLTLTAAGELAGLGNADVVITLSAEGDASALCRNRGGNIAPGQNKIPVLVTATQTVLAEEIKNGTTPYVLTTDGPEQPTAAQAGCPNGNWTAEINDVVFTSATISVEQAGVLVLEQTFRL